MLEKQTPGDEQVTEHEDKWVLTGRSSDVKPSLLFYNRLLKNVDILNLWQVQTKIKKKTDDLKKK